MIVSAKYVTAGNTEIEAVDTEGRIWHGITPDGAGQIPAAVRAWVAAGNTPSAYVTSPITGNEVDLERDKRLFVFTFGGKQYDFDPASQLNVSGAFSLALAAVIGGAGSGNFRWSDPDYDFAWIAADNTTVTMDAPTMVAFGKASAEWKSAHIYAARVLKDTNPIPADYKDNAHWPSP